MLSKVARGLETQMARRRREEHESNHVGAGIQRDVECLGRGQAANFHDQGHGSKHGWGGDKRRKKRCAWGAFYNVAPCLSRPLAPYKPPCDGAEKRGGAPRGGAAAARRPTNCGRICPTPAFFPPPPRRH